MYDRLVGEEKKKWAEGSAQSYFLARIEARVLDSFASHCVEICKPVSGRVLEHLSLQFDGAEVLMDSFPPDFKVSAEDAIARDTGFIVSLSEKRHFFAGDEIVISALSAYQSLDPPSGSILYEPGNCVILALYRVRDDKDFLEVYETVARNHPTGERKVRSYSDCVDYLCRGSLSHVCIRDLVSGGRYLLHADGRGSDPHCLSMVVDKKGVATISSGTASYRHDIHAVKDILAAAVDKPIAIAFASSGKPSVNSGSRGIEGAHGGLMKLEAGSCVTCGA